MLGKESQQRRTSHCFLTLAVLCALFCIPTALSANILAIFPTASYSHQMPLLSLARALAQKGHKLTVITPNPFRVSTKY